MTQVSYLIIAVGIVNLEEIHVLHKIPERNLATYHIPDARIIKHGTNREERLFHFFFFSKTLQRIAFVDVFINQSR